jgi:cytoskeletal protein CcmA (bactofilin family)
MNMRLLTNISQDIDQMSLKDALNKRTPFESNQGALGDHKREHMPSPNDPIRSYPVSTESRESSPSIRSAERIVTIGESVVLKGDISDCDKAEIRGQIDGTIVASSIQISEGGSVKGTIECEELSIAGSVDGKVTSTKSLEIKATGEITGEILYKALLVTSGGEISGSLEKQKVAESPATITTQPS